MHLYPVDRDAFVAALSAAKVGTGPPDGCVAGLVAVRVPRENARYLLAALARSLGMAAYDRLRVRPRPDLEVAPSDVVTFCVTPDLRGRLAAPFSAAVAVGDREGGLEIDMDNETSRRLLATAALALDAEIRPAP